MKPDNPAATEVLAVEPLREVDRDRDDLIPAIERLLAASGRTLAQVKQVAVSVGPGGFTSTRVASAAGAMLAEGLGVPAIAVPSALSALAAVEGGGAGTVAVLMASKGAAAWCAVLPADLSRAAASAARDGRMMTGAEVLATGALRALADEHLSAEVRLALGAAGVVVQPLRSTPAACLAAASVCEPISPSLLVPIYPREPEAVTLWRQRHGDSGGAATKADTPGR